MKKRTLMSILPTAFLLCLGTLYLNELGLDGLLAFLAIGIGSTLLISTFLISNGKESSKL